VVIKNQHHNNKKLSILFLGSQMETGGAQKVLFEQAQWFAAQGHSVSVVFLYDKEGLHDEWREKYEFPIINIYAYKYKGFYLLNLLRILRGMWRLFKFLRRNNFDVIETFTIHSNVFALPIAWVCKIPVRVATHHGYVENAPQWLEKLHGLITNSQIISRIVIVSNDAAQIATTREGIKVDRMIIIPNGIQGFEQSNNEKIRTVRQALNIPENSILILSIGRLVPQKGIEILLEAASVVRAVNQRIYFAIAGDGPLKNDLLTQRDQLGLQEVVNFLGIRSDIPDLLSAADIFLMTSHWEGMSIALLEAMSLAKPIVTTAVEGANQVIKSSVNGVLVPVGDVQSISSALVTIADDEKLRIKLGQSAREEFIKSHSLEKTCSEYEQVFLKLFTLNH
jgi:glycosyltransferase involved in cell wall biosynthesis